MFLLSRLLVLLISVLGSSQHQLTVEVDAGGEECYFQFLNVGETLTVEYQVLDTSGEFARLDIDFRLSMPTGEPVIVQYRREEGRHSFQGGKIRVGDYKICFDNKFSLLSSKLVFFEVLVDNEESDAGRENRMRVKPELQEYQETADEIYMQLYNIRRTVMSAAGQQNRMLIFHGKDTSLADRNIRRVDNLSFVMVNLIIMASMLQAFMIKKLFDTKINEAIKPQTGQSMLKWRQSEVMTFSPPPRSCQVVKWPEFNGYGFTLHNNKETGVQTIGGVDEKSPAAAAGLRMGDIIIEINGANVTRENHTQVVERIKASGDTTVFLVADNECKEYHDREDKLICSSLPYVIHLSSARSGDQMREGSDDEEKVAEKDPSLVPLPASLQKHLDTSSSSSSYSSQHEEEAVAPLRSITTAPPMMATKGVSVASSSSEEEMSQPVRVQSPPKASSRNTKGSKSKSQLVDGMRLNLSAREMRKVVSEEARQETRGFKRSESREERKMSFQEKSKWFNSLKKTSQTAA